MRLIFVRHAQSEANAEGRLQGHSEYGLSEEGRAQAQRLYERFRKEGFQPTHIYSSPQRRTAETAQIVAQGWGAHVVYWEELKEHDIGIFSGLTWDEIRVKYPELFQEFHRHRDWDVVEGAEPFGQRRVRAQRVIDRVLRRHANEDAVLLFTHGGILQHMLSCLVGAERTWGMEVRNTAIFDFSLDLERWPLDGAGRHNTFFWRINRFNDASHLGTGD
jgi:broad specificity phosphatase PhoE